MRNINEAFENEEYTRLKEIKDKSGYKSWRKFIIDGAEELWKMR